MAAAAVDETLPTIDFPNHPPKKKGRRKSKE
jgi:hypothetical protein